MTPYKRKYPLFSLCGLPCGLCPRYQTDGASKCPGCGGPDFHLKHPSCAVISCSQKHGGVEYCFQCSSYPCPKYRRPSTADSFISYKNVLSDFERAREVGLERFRKEMDRKVRILESLIEDYNDGRSKGFYCLAVNLLSLPDLESAFKDIKKEKGGSGQNKKEAAASARALLESLAKKKKIELRLRKP